MAAETCVSCQGRIGGRAIHDRGEAWCAPCRQFKIEAAAAARANILIRRDLDLARTVARIQRKAVAA